MIDPLEPNGKKLPDKIHVPVNLPEEIKVDTSNSIWSRTLDDLSFDMPYAKRPDTIISVDSTGYNPSTPNINTYFPNSISNWRSRIKEIGASERRHLPLWMRSIQPSSRQELGFILAIPLCYCKVGYADDILLNIKNSNFDFKLLDYTADRYIIDAVDNYTSDKYLVFRNDRITL